MAQPLSKRKPAQKKTEALGNSIYTLLLPPEKIETEHYRIYSHAKSAKEFGGDWWGISEVKRKDKPSLLNLVMGDATGHGAPAALLAATTRGALSILAEWAAQNPEMASDPRELLKILNRVVFEAAQGSMVMTLVAIVYDPITGVIRTANAGHCLPYVVTPAENNTWTLKALGGGGVPLGHALDTDYSETDTYTWVKNSKLVLYTDGLIDVYNGDQNLFDRRALQRVLRSLGSLSAEEILSQLLVERKKMTGKRAQADDVTVLIAELF